MTPVSLTSGFGKPCAAPVAARAIWNAAESRFFILLSPFEQASCEPLCRNYNGGDILGK